MEAVQKTPEREAFYKKIDGENLSALWNVLGDLITPDVPMLELNGKKFFQQTDLLNGLSLDIARLLTTQCLHKAVLCKLR